MYDGLNAFSVLGASGDPAVPGLGFHSFTIEGQPLPIVTGLPGIFEGHCPPHLPNMRAAVEAVVARKFGTGGPFHAGTPGPYKENGAVRGAAAPMDTHFVDCVVTMADYIHETFGRFPPPCRRSFRSCISRRINSTPSSTTITSPRAPTCALRPSMVGTGADDPSAAVFAPGLQRMSDAGMGELA